MLLILEPSPSIVKALCKEIPCIVEVIAQAVIETVYKNCCSLATKLFVMALRRRFKTKTRCQVILL